MDAHDPTRDLTPALLLLALQVARAHGHHTLTFRAALGVAAFAARHVEHRPLSGLESPEALDQMAGLLRDMIRAAPDRAAGAASALRDLNAFAREVSRPRGWRPTASQVARAAQVLGVPPREVHDTAFTEDGGFHARTLGGNFVEVPLGGLNPAEEREDA